jgi:hypothetical protein
LDRALQGLGLGGPSRGIGAGMGDVRYVIPETRDVKRRNRRWKGAEV